MEIEQVGGKIVQIHNWGSIAGGNPVGDAIEQRIHDAMSFDGGDMAHKEAATSLLGVTPGVSTYRSGAVPAEILWRVVEDPTIVPEERAAAVRALAPSLDEGGKARMRVVIEAAVSPELHDAIAGEALKSGRLGS